jgi:sulfur carrier protein
VSAPLRVLVNGEEREVPSGLTVSGLIELLGLGSGPVAIERNREVVPRAQHPSTALEDRDVIEIVHFVGGG